MKKMLFGVSLIVCGIIGVLALILSVIPMSQALGSVSGNSSVVIYLDWYGLTPLFGGFIIMCGVGIIVCVVESYFNKSAKKHSP